MTCCILVPMFYFVPCFFLCLHYIVPVVLVDTPEAAIELCTLIKKGQDSVRKLGSTWVGEGLANNAAFQACLSYACTKLGCQHQHYSSHVCILVTHLY